MRTRWVKYLIYITVTVFLLRNCCHIYVTHMSSEDMEWIKPYENKKRFVFLSNKGVDDTLYISQTIKQNKFLPFYVSSAGRIDTILAWCRVDGRIGNSSDYSDFYFNLSKEKDGYGAVLSYAIGNNVGNSDNKIPLEIINTYMSSVKIDKNIYTDCYIGDNTNYIEGDSISKAKKLKRIIFSKGYGLIYYEYENGDSYRRKDL